MASDDTATTEGDDDRKLISETNAEKSENDNTPNNQNNNSTIRRVHCSDSIGSQLSTLSNNTYVAGSISSPSPSHSHSHSHSNSHSHHRSRLQRVSHSNPIPVSLSATGVAPPANDGLVLSPIQSAPLNAQSAEPAMGSSMELRLPETIPSAIAAELATSHGTTTTTAYDASQSQEMILHFPWTLHNDSSLNSDRNIIFHTPPSLTFIHHSSITDGDGATDATSNDERFNPTPLTLPPSHDSSPQRSLTHSSDNRNSSLLRQMVPSFISRSATRIVRQWLPNPLSNVLSSDAFEHKQSMVDTVIDDSNAALLTYDDDALDRATVLNRNLDGILSRLQDLQSTIQTRAPPHFHHPIQSSITAKSACSRASDNNTCDDTDLLSSSASASAHAPTDGDHKLINAEMKNLLSITMDIASLFGNNRISRYVSRVGGFGVTVMGRLIPHMYDIVEYMLLESWTFIREVIEYYDSDPKGNFILQLIEKMNNIFATIQAIIALSECYMERNIGSDTEFAVESYNDDDDAEDDDDDDDDDDSDSDGGGDEDHLSHHFITDIETDDTMILSQASHRPLIAEMNENTDLDLDEEHDDNDNDHDDHYKSE